MKQEASRASPIHTRSPEVSSNLAGSEVQDTVKSLTEKLSAALSNISAKDALVKQHAKVAEEAVSGNQPGSIFSSLVFHMIK